MSRGPAVDRTPSGIIIPDNSTEPPQEGIVTSVGWKMGEQDDHTVRPGDEVLLPKYGGVSVVRDGVEYTLIDEADLLGVLVEVKNVFPG